MKKLFLICSMLTISALSFAKTDTTIVEFEDKPSNSKIRVITGKKTIEIPRILNLNNILKAMGVDSNERERAIVISDSETNRKDTLFVLSRDGGKVKIVTRELPKSAQKETVERPERPERPEQPEAVEVPEFDNLDKKLDKAPKKAKKTGKFFSRSDFGLYLGLNGFRNVADNQETAELRFGRSRYVALSFRKNATLVKGKAVDVALSYSPEIAWYNFMFKNSNTARFENNQVSFVANAKATEKSKLVVPYINLPVLLNFGFKEDKFKIGFGGYLGYRVGGYTKEKFASGGKNKTEGSFGLEKPIYGLTAEIGKKGGLTLFGRFDMGTLFKSNQTNAKDIQAFSVGIRL